MGLRRLRLLCLFFTSMSLGPALLYLFGSTSRFDLAGEGDIAAQQIFRDLTISIIILACALITTLALTITVRKQHKTFVCTLIAFFCLAWTQVAVLAITYSISATNGDGSILPANLLELRRQWDLIYVVASVLNFTALVLLNLSPIKNETTKKARRAAEMAFSITGVPENAHTQFLQNVASFHSSWYEVRLAEFRRSTEENQGRHKATAA